MVAMTTSLGCYAYRPGGVPPRAGESVRVVLTPEGSTELARYLGPGVAVAEGTLNSVAGDGSYMVAVTFVQTMAGIKQPWTGEGVVSIPAQYRADVQQRTFLRNQTIVASALTVGALIGIAVAAFSIAGGSGGGSGNGGGQPPP